MFLMEKLQRRTGFLTFLLVFAVVPKAASGEASLKLPQKFKMATQYFLDHLEISYVYGGSQIGSLADCDQCNACLAAKEPNPDKRLSTCPKCVSCSLDCSHFVREIMQLVGQQVPYLTTADMIESSPKRLSSLGYEVISEDPTSWRTGDIFLYKGHVVMLEDSMGDGRGTIVHATSGREIKASGQGIQRARFVRLDDFRGPLLRVLRHKAFVQYYSTFQPLEAAASTPRIEAQPAKKFRPIGSNAR